MVHTQSGLIYPIHQVDYRPLSNSYRLQRGEKQIKTKDHIKRVSVFEKSGKKKYKHDLM